MPVTLTIKQVPERIAERLRARAAASHRSLQGELMAILEAAVPPASSVAEPKPAPYAPRRENRRTTGADPGAHGRKLTLAELWERSRALGGPSKSESAAIVRTMRDERHGR
jgi:plasmid stability protein